MYNKKQLYLLRTLFFRQTNHRPFISIERGEEKKFFNTIHQCAQFLSVSTEHVWGHFVTQFPLQGWTVRHVKHNDREAVDAKSYRSTRRPEAKSNIRIKRPVKVYDICTKKIETFNSLSECGKHYGAKASHIRLRITVPEKIRLLYQRFIIIDEERTFDFLTPAVLEKVISKINYGVSVFNGKQNKVVQFSGITAFMRLHKREREIENAIRVLQSKGIYTVSDHLFMMKTTAAMVTMCEEELITLFLNKINEIYTYRYQSGGRGVNVQ